MANTVKRNCLACGVSFQGRKHAKTCSDRCRKRLQRLTSSVKQKISEEGQKAENAVQVLAGGVEAALTPVAVAVDSIESGEENIPVSASFSEAVVGDSDTTDVSASANEETKPAPSRNFRWLVLAVLLLLALPGLGWLQFKHAHHDNSRFGDLQNAQRALQRQQKKLTAATGQLGVRVTSLENKLALLPTSSGTTINNTVINQSLNPGAPVSDNDNLNSLVVNGSTVISDKLVLQNVTTDTSILTSGLLGVNRGGTGVGGFTTNGVIFGNGANGLQVTTAGSGGQLLLANNSGTPTFTTLSGDATLSASGNLTLANTAVAAGTYGDATHVGQFTVDAKGRITSAGNVQITGAAPTGAAGGDLGGTYPNPTIAKLQGTTLTTSALGAGQILQYNGTAWVNQTVSGDISINGSGVASIGAGKVTNTDLVNSSLSVNAGNGLSGGGSVALGGSTSLAVLYGSAANTSVQGNTTVICPSGTGNLTGGGNTLILGTGGSCNSLNTINSPSYSGNLTVQGSSGVTVGMAGATAGVLNLANATNSNLSKIQPGAPSGSGTATYNLPSIAGGSSDTFCLATLQNCTAIGVAGGDLTGSYPNPTIAKLQGSTLTISSLASGQILQYNGSAIVNGLITNSNLQSGSFGGITGVGALTSGSIGSGFGTISTGSNITTTTNLQGGTISLTTLGSASNATYLCYNSSNQIASCNTTGNGVAFAQGGNSFAATAELGTNDANALNFRTNNSDKLQLDTSGNLILQQASTFKIALATTGTQLIIQGGAASGGTNVGGNLLLQGGAGASTGASGSVIVQSNTNNSLTAFEVQNAAGTSNSLDVDTTNSRVGIGTLAPGFKLDIQGAGNDGLNIQSGDNTKYTLIQLGRASAGEFDFGVAASANQFLTGTVAGDDAVKANSGNLYLGSSVSAKVVVVRNNGNNNTTAFSVQNTSGAAILDVDTQNGFVGINMTPSYDLSINNGGGGSSGLGSNQIQLNNSSSDNGGFLLGYTSSTQGILDASGGAEFNGTNWIAKSANIALLQIGNTALQYFSNSGLTVGSSFTPTQVFAVGGANVNLINIHLKETQTTAPTIGTPSNCGSGPTAAVKAASTDGAGAFRVTAGTGSPTTCDTVISFNGTFAAAPKSIIVSSETIDGGTGTAAARQIYVSASGTGNFTVKMNSSPAASEVNWFYYWVVE